MINSLRTMGAGCFRFLQDTHLAVATRSMNQELARRNSERERYTPRWFTRDEAVVAEALARIIVPSDEETPGIDEVGVLDPPALLSLDSLIAKSSFRQGLYSRGLLSFDMWAQNRQERKFADISKADQIILFKDAEQLYERWTERASGMTKAYRRFRAISQARSGSFFAAQLYPQIRNDCLQVFYTSRVSWVWLDYDGPPMDRGYSSVATRRED